MYYVDFRPLFFKIWGALEHWGEPPIGEVVEKSLITYTQSMK